MAQRNFVAIQTNDQANRIWPDENLDNLPQQSGTAGDNDLELRRFRPFEQQKIREQFPSLVQLQCQ